ncbi:hypothetical protein BS47DRAFT_1364250 [Hydnum rufescens UP504]|uniref:Uncharacterized protein n=1 Tax=Hydnum rufescens UP504 TaxID=1448309 RepID=A0A9P6ATY8_9AGAM|nr:hypothetical protein BS47DRAFT_1364250 [Hydnum rufescens UP504]
MPQSGPGLHLGRLSRGCLWFLFIWAFMVLFTVFICAVMQGFVPGFHLQHVVQVGGFGLDGWVCGPILLLFWSVVSYGWGFVGGALIGSRAATAALFLILPHTCHSGGFQLWGGGDIQA